jgi:hypothetical protein
MNSRPLISISAVVAASIIGTPRRPPQVIPDTVNMLDDARNADALFWGTVGFACGWLAHFAFSLLAEASARRAARRRCFLPDRVLDENRRREKIRTPDRRSVRFP